MWRMGHRKSLQRLNPLHDPSSPETMDCRSWNQKTHNFPRRKTYQFFLPIENKELTKIVSLIGNDLETSELLYSAMFCINQKNAFLICKSSVFLLHCQSYSSEKIEKIKHLLIIVHLLHILVMKISSTVLLLIPYRFYIIFEPAHLRIARW